MDMNRKISINDLSPMEDLSNLASQISHASEIETTLRAVKRLDESDRKVFAENLGVLYESAVAKMSDLNISSLFKSVFTEDEANSLIKKRKTLIIFEDEEPNSSGLYTRANRYIELSRQLCQMQYAAHENVNAIAILNLIKGSSFDFDGAVRDRLKQASFSELNRILRHITNKVRKSVDLEWMHAWTQDHEMYASCENGGSLSESEDHHNFFRVDLSLEGCFSSSFGAEGAPSITLEERICPVEVADFEFVTLVRSKDAEDESINILKQILIDRKDLNNVEEEDQALTDDFFTDLPYQNWHEFFANAQSKREKRDADFELEMIGSDDEDRSERRHKIRKLSESTVPAKLYVDLELRFSKSIAAWVPTIIQRCHENNGSTILLGKEDYSTVYCDWRGEPAHALWSGEHGDYVIYGIKQREAELEDGSVKEDWKIFQQSWSFVSDMEKEITSLRQRLFVDGESFYNFTHKKPSFDRSQYEETRHYEKVAVRKENASRIENLGYTPAPSDSIADLIMRNMAYANDDDRIDNLLIKDAEQKYQFLKKREAERSAAYKACIAGKLTDV